MVCHKNINPRNRLSFPNDKILNIQNNQPYSRKSLEWMHATIRNTHTQQQPQEMAVEDKNYLSQ